MNPDYIAQLIRAGLECEHVEVDGDGRHFQALVVSDRFENKNILAQHRLVMATLSEHFDSEALHALSLKTLTPERWSQQS